MKLDEDSFGDLLEASPIEVSAELLSKHPQLFQNHRKDKIVSD